MASTIDLPLRLERQENPVADEVSAITAVVRPILTGVLYGLKTDVAQGAGGYDQLPLFMLARLRRPGDGDTGICFEYAVHDAIRRGEPVVLDRISEGIRRCGIGDGNIDSILFGAEKNGALNLIDTATQLLTDESALLTGNVGRPIKLKKHIWGVAAAFRKPAYRQFLPSSISGLWKADLFAGSPNLDRWVGTTLKINQNDLEGGRGLRLGIVPSHQGRSDAVRRDTSKNLIVCPIPYDGSFMQVFFQAWEVVVQFLTADAKIPDEASLPRPASRQVARYLEDRRRFPVLKVIEALRPLGQPHLLETEESTASFAQTGSVVAETTSTVLAPIPSLK